MVKNIQFVEILLTQINTKYIEENEVILEFQKHPDFLMEAMVEAINGGYQFLEPVCFQINPGEDYYLIDGWDVYQAYQQAHKETIKVELRQDKLEYHLSLITAQKKPLRHICPSLKERKQSYRDDFIRYLKIQPLHIQENWSLQSCANLFGYETSSISRRFKKLDYQPPESVRARRNDGFLMNTQILREIHCKKDWQGFRWEAISPDQLEQLVYGIIESYQPYEIIRTSGPGGKGKDIIAKFRTTGHLKEEYDETYYIEVKHSEVNRQVSVDQIQAALSWVLVNKPNCFVMAVSSQLSSTTRDCLEDLKKKCPDVRVVLWQRDEIETRILEIDKVREKAVEMKLLPKSK